MVPELAGTLETGSWRWPTTAALMFCNGHCPKTVVTPKPVPENFRCLGSHAPALCQAVPPARTCLPTPGSCQAQAGAGLPLDAGRRQRLRLPRGQEGLSKGQERLSSFTHHSALVFWPLQPLCEPWLTLVCMSLAIVCEPGFTVLLKRCPQNEIYF